jgi:hypothetical protein
MTGESAVNAESAKFSAAVAVDAFLPQEVEDVTIEDIDLDDASVEYSVYDHYAGDTRAISASVEVGVEFHGFVYRMDIELVDDEIIEVVDDDWNDHWTFVQMTTKLRMFFDLLIVGTTVENTRWTPLGASPN